MTVQNNDGPGATFVVLLPEAQAAAGHAGHAARPAAAGPGEQGTETILLVEDDSAVLRATVRILEHSGYRVRPALNCDEAMAHAAAPESIDLLLSDLVMPGCPGRELARRIVGLRPHLPVLFMTGYSDDQVSDASGVGPEPMLAKPTAPHVLLRAVRELLDARTALARTATAAGRR